MTLPPGSTTQGQSSTNPTPSPEPNYVENEAFPVRCYPVACGENEKQLLLAFVPLADLPDCLNGSTGGCALAAADVIPFGKILGGLGKVVGAMVVATKATKITSRGIWDLYYGTERGKRIEKLLGQNLHDSYPVVDRYETLLDEAGNAVGGLATSIKSRDLASTTYQTGNKLKNQLREDIDGLAGIRQMTDYANNQLDGMPITKRVLTVAIPPGPMTASQHRAFRQAFTYAQSRGVIFDVVILTA